MLNKITHYKKEIYGKVYELNEQTLWFESWRVLKIMTVKIKKLKYLVAPKDLLNDAVDVLVDLEDDSDEFGYVVEVTTP